MLHLPTIVLFTLTLLVAVSLVFALTVRLYPDRPGLKYWPAGCLLLAVGYALRLFDIADATNPLFWWAGLFFISGNLVICLGILHFCRLQHRFPTRWIAPSFLLAWGLAAFLPYAQQVAINLGLAGITCAFAGLVLLRASELEEPLLRWSVSGTYLVSGAVLMTRGLLIGLDINSVLSLQIEEMNAIGAPLSTALIMLRCFALLVLVHADQEAMLRGLATTDILTGLHNRQGFFEQSNRLLERHADRCSCRVLMMDLDYFKQVNDRYGHAAGDTVLRRFAMLLRAQLRPEDTIGRIGGEEFSILLVDTSLKDAQEIAERLRCAWHDQPISFGEQQLQCSVSIGIGSCSGPLEARLLEADHALYQAKQGGRNRVVSSGSG